MILEQSKSEEIEKIFEESYWVSHSTDSSILALKAYFLDTSLPKPQVTVSSDYAFSYLFSGVMKVYPKELMGLLFEKGALSRNSLHLLFSEHFYYFLKHIPYLEEHYAETLVEGIAFLPLESSRRAEVLDALYRINDSKYKALLLESAQKFHLGKYSSFREHFNEKSLAIYYYEMAKVLLPTETFQPFAEKILSEIESKNAKDLPYFFKELKALASSEVYRKVIENYYQNYCRIDMNLEFIVQEFPEDINYFFELMLKRDSFDINSDVRQKLYVALKEVDFSSYFDTLWHFGEGLENYGTISIAEMNLVAKTLVKYEALSFEYAQKALKSKKINEKLFGYLVLAKLGDEVSMSLFKESFQMESNDKKLREVLLPMIAPSLYQERLSLDEVNELIAYAQKRKKFAKWKEPFAQEDLPKLYFKDGAELSSEQVHFLFYRMSLMKEMESDIEVNLLLHHVDKTRSVEFAKFILEGFLANGSKAPQKYLMALAGILGDETLLEYLKKLFNEVYEAKRMKMAQFVIGTIALVGTDRALRFIELVSRKYKKKQALHEYCLKALDIAAKELGITADELSEKIIPDFGFEGLYKTIEIEGEEYRVFVAKDFKLQYINEENKIRKSLPKQASKELKAELKSIQAEIRDVNKAGAGRLEQYMVKERRWEMEAWQRFYLFNPVMFIYASTLVWGLYDASNELKELFYVDEDSSLLNLEDDELE